MKRRSVLATLTSATTVALAGCSVNSVSSSCEITVDESPTKEEIRISFVKAAGNDNEIEVESRIAESSGTETSVARMLLVHDGAVVAETTDITTTGTTTLTSSETDLEGENTFTVRFEDDAGETIDQSKIVTNCSSS
jgi:hypothetical protein